MKKNLLKGLLTVSTVAAMLGSVGVQAQDTATSTARPTGQAGGTGKDQQGGSSSGSSGMSGSTGTSGSGQGMSSSQGASGAAGGTAAGETKATLSKGDEKILKNMAQANIDEVEAGKMAASKAQNDEVKKFAQQMVDDHTKALTEVQQVAQQKGVTLPTEPDAKHKKMAASLDKSSGDAFDKAYMKNAGVSDHKHVLSELKKIEKNAKDPDVKGLATKMIPVVEQHLKAAEQIHMAKAGTTSGK